MRVSPTAPKTPNIDPALLPTLLDYDRETGALTWRARPAEMFSHPCIAAAWNTKFAGTPALFKISSSGYRRGELGGRDIYAHRAIWAFVTGEWPTLQVDHIDRNPLNNRWNNLRLATSRQNLANRAKRPGSSSVFMGVCWSKRRQKWQATVSINDFSKSLGYFANPEDAARAYDAGAIEAHGEFASTNVKLGLLPLSDGSLPALFHSGGRP